MGRPKKIVAGDDPAKEVTDSTTLNNPSVSEEGTVSNLGTVNIPPEPASTPVKKEETVEIKKSDYDKLMAQLERNAKDIDLLYKASDKNRMAKALGEGGEILIHKANVWTWADTGIIVLASKLITNRSEVFQGKVIEDQISEVYLEDGQIITVPYLEFSRKILNKVPAEIVASKKTRDEKNKEITIFTLQFSDGKQLEINSAFVN